MKTKNLVVSAVLTAALALGVTLLPTEAAAKPKPKVVKVDVSDSPIEVLEVIEGEGDRAILRVRNRTPFILIAYIHGVRIGWLRPFRTGLLRGLRRGFHRMYAHSRWGSFYWGPRSVWIPGTWSLYR